MALVSLADYQAAARYWIRYFKAGGTNTQMGIGSLNLDLSAISGSPGAIATVSNTTSGVVPVGSDSGYPSLPAFSGTRYLTGVRFASSEVPARLMLYDRLWHAGKFVIGSSPYSLSSQPSISARVPGGNYSGLQLWGIGGGNNAGTTVTVTYTDQDGNAGASTPAHPIPYFVAGTPTQIYSTWQIPLASGDSGLQKVESVTLTNGAATAECNLMIVRPLWSGVTAGTVGRQQEFGRGLSQTWLAEVPTNAALQAILQWSLVSTSPTIDMEIELSSN